MAQFIKKKSPGEFGASSYVIKAINDEVKALKKSSSHLITILKELNIISRKRKVEKKKKALSLPLNC